MVYWTLGVHVVLNESHCSQLLKNVHLRLFQYFWLTDWKRLLRSRNISLVCTMLNLQNLPCGSVSPFSWSYLIMQPSCFGACLTLSINPKPKLDRYSGTNNSKMLLTSSSLALRTPFNLHLVRNWQFSFFRNDGWRGRGIGHFLVFTFFSFSSNLDPQHLCQGWHRCCGCVAAFVLL